MTNKQRYIEFCERESIPIFMQPFWLDVVCSDNNMDWGVILYEKGGQIWGSFVYCIKRKYGFTLISMPKLTQFLGPYIKYPQEQKYCKKLSWEKEVMNYFIDNLPKFDYFKMNFHYSITNWLPFYWRGFNQTTRYTYVIEDLRNLDNVIAKFSHAKRKQIKKAERSGIMVLPNDITVDQFYKLHQSELKYEKKGNIIYPKRLLLELFSIVSQYNSGAFFVAKDKNKNIHGALFIVWTNYSAYDLVSAFNPNYLSSGASTLLIKEVLKYVKKIGIDKFDFEGSMIESVENSFRQFNTIQKPYFQITKVNSKILKLRNCLREFLK